MAGTSIFDDRILGLKRYEGTGASQEPLLKELTVLALREIFDSEVDRLYTEEDAVAAALLRSNEESLRVLGLWR